MEKLTTDHLLCFSPSHSAKDLRQQKQTKSTLEIENISTHQESSTPGQETKMQICRSTVIVTSSSTEHPGGQREKGNVISCMIFKETFEESETHPDHYSQSIFSYRKFPLITSLVLPRSAR